MVVVHPTLFINPGRSVIGCTVVNDYWYLNFTSFNSTISFKITTHLFLTRSAWHICLKVYNVVEINFSRSLSEVAYTEMGIQIYQNIYVN